MIRHLLVLFAAALLVAVAVLPASSRATEVLFPEGVASGDVRHTTAVLWTRADGPAALTWEVATDAGFGDIVRRGRVAALEENDFTVKPMVGGLKADQTYYYRFLSGESASQTGTFRTSPLPSRSADVLFAWSSDFDGTRVNGEPARGKNYEVLDAVRADGPAFFIPLGDTAYADALGVVPDSQEHYWFKHRENRSYQAFRDLLASTSVYAIWDDHEVINDFAGTTVSPALLEMGRKAFFDYWPIRVKQQEPERLYRSFRWGKDVEIIILDERQYRSPDVVSEGFCLLPGDIPDLGPTLPALVRQLGGLPAEPPEGCLEALSDPVRTMLGSEQKQWLKDTLLASDATFKFIVNEVPITEIFALPYDRWEGYRAERDEILAFIRDNGVENVVFLTGDLHGNIISDVRISALVDPTPIAKEIVAGPIQQSTFKASAVNFLGGGEAGEETFNALLLLLGPLIAPVGPDSCIHVDTIAYGVVEVDSAAKIVTVTVKDEQGDLVGDMRDSASPCQVSISG